MAADYRVKFLFVNAQTIEMTFPAAITVAEAKNKLIESWPAGAVPLTLPAWPHKCALPCGTHTALHGTLMRQDYLPAK